MVCEGAECLQNCLDSRSHKRSIELHTDSTEIRFFSRLFNSFHSISFYLFGIVLERTFRHKQIHNSNNHRHKHTASEHRFGETQKAKSSIDN